MVGSRDQTHTVPNWASGQAAVCIGGTRPVVLGLAGPALDPPPLLHGLHK